MSFATPWTVTCQAPLSMGFLRQEYCSGLPFPSCPWDSPGKNTGVGCHFLLQCMKVKSEREVAQLCLTLSDAMDCSLLGSSVHGILQARILEWAAIIMALPRYNSHTKKIHCLKIYNSMATYVQPSLLSNFKTFTSP